MNKILDLLILNLGNSKEFSEGEKNLKIGFKENEELNELLKCIINYKIILIE